MEFVYLCCSSSMKSVIDPTIIDISNSALLDRLINETVIEKINETKETVIEKINDTKETVIEKMNEEPIFERDVEVKVDDVNKLIIETIKDMKTKIEESVESADTFANNI